MKLGFLRFGFCKPKGCCGKSLKKKCPVNKTLIRIYLVGIVVLFGSAFAITMLFPFLPFMIKFLLPQLDEASVGKYAGIVASSMFFGRFLGSYIWGAIADSKGRKPVLIASSLLLGLSSAAFGFSVHFAMAVIFRFSVGLTNGIIGTMKAMIAEASDDRTQAFGITVLTCAWGFGFILGPAISGAIADPIGQYNLNITNPVIHGFLTRFPYSLPCLVNFLICLLSAILVALFLPETLGMKQKKKQDDGLLEEDACSDVIEQSSDDQEEGVASDQQMETHFVDDASDESYGDVDLGTLGRRPFAQRDDASVIQRSTALEVIVESPEPHPIDSPGCEPKPKSRSDQESPVSQTDSGLSLRLSSRSDGDTVDSANSSVVNTASSNDGFKLVAGLRFSSDFGGPQPAGGQVEEVDLGELRPSQLEERESFLDGEKYSAQPSIKKATTGQKTPLRKQRKRSFLIPFFNRRDSFTPSFVKPSLSALREKFKRRGREGESPVCSDASSEQEEIEMEGDTAAAGESEEERLLEDRDREAESKSSWFRWKLKRFKKSVKMALRDLKLFLCDRATLLALLTYCTFSFAVIGYEEVYSLWAATSPSLGGLGFTLHEIGTSLAVVGVVLLPFMLFLYPVMERYFGSIKSFQLCTTVLLFVVIMVPNIHYLGLNVLLWGVLCVSQLILRVCIGVCFGATTLLINNSVTADKLGAVNGFAVSLTAFFRTVAPVFSGGIYSASLSKTTRAIGFPLDYHLIFVLFSVVFLSSALMAACLPEKVNRQKIKD